MEDFRIIYRVLKFLDESMDYDEFDSENFTAGRFGTNDNRFHALLMQLQKSGYIEGLDIVGYIRQKPMIKPPACPVITLKGLEYLNENSMMKKAAKMAKGDYGYNSRIIITTSQKMTGGIFIPIFKEGCE